MPQDLVIQELQAKLFDCYEELKIYKRNEKQMDYLTRENEKLQNEKLCLRETLQRAMNKIAFMEEENGNLKSNLYGFQLSEKAAEKDIKKLHGTIDDLRKEIGDLKMTIDDLTNLKRTTEQSLKELKQSASLSEESAQTKRKVLEEQITALKKVNNKLEQALLRNTDPDNLITTNSISSENVVDSTTITTINSLPQTQP